MVRIWCVQTGELLLTFTDHKVEVERTARLQYSEREKQEHGFQYAAWSPDSRRVASLRYDYTIFVWDALTGAQLMEPLRDLCGHSNDPYEAVNFRPSHVAFGKQTPLLVSAGYGTITVWDLSHEGQAIVKHRLVSPEKDSVQHMSLSPDDRHIASWCVEYNIIRVWDVGTGTEVRQFRGHKEYMVCAQWSNDSQSLFSGDGFGELCEWSMDEEV